MDDDWSAGHPPDADVVVVHTPTFQVNENTAVTRHRKWRWWTSKLTDLPDQNPVSFNIVHRLLLIDRADERVDSFQKRPTKTPPHFCVTSFARLAFSFSSRAARVPGDRRRETKRRGDTCCSQTCPHNRSTARACAFHAPRACIDAEHRVYHLRRYVDSCHCVVYNVTSQNGFG